MHVSASHQSATLWTGLELLQKDGFEHLPLLTEALPISKKAPQGEAGTADKSAAMTQTLLQLPQ